MNILVTGSSGFLGTNLLNYLKSKSDISVLTYNKENNLNELENLCLNSDVVFHFAAVLRPENTQDYYDINVRLTSIIIEILEKKTTPTKFVFSSSIQVNLNNEYGKSKLLEEKIIMSSSKKITYIICRFPNLFGKYAVPNTTNVISTFCYNTSHNLPVTINDGNKYLNIAFVDDILIDIIGKLECESLASSIIDFNNSYMVKLIDLLYTIIGFADDQKKIGILNEKLENSLYETYLYYKKSGKY
ncbi:MAG: NAD-dependent epimerase/dehydratase [Candidatus Magasanikbacteria bacterium GW2011_GWC2_34_16]|uniref:NAD-dependent epimerase/dehydratase n=1 Tax=Candidatus Magasanikbacteria bacterium GW2011_GWC2_34_16 TaxID=1619045 RepID=A0A0G0AQE1_9BACT|nr:MAG: NAD-dependent epimerase/dehydratase [Candidatus Magasanikbacteria bacterium GW2011_GWC2_34_16]